MGFDWRWVEMRRVASRGCSAKEWLDQRRHAVLVGGAVWERLSQREKRRGKMPARRKKRWRVETRGWIAVGAVVSCSMLPWKRRSAELDLGCRKPVDHLHRATAKRAYPESKSANKSQTWRIDGVRFLHRVQ